MKGYVNSDEALAKKRKWLEDNPLLAEDTPIIREGREEYNYLKSQHRLSDLEEDLLEEDEYEEWDEYEEEEEEGEQISLAEEASIQMFFDYMRDMDKKGIDPNSKKGNEEMQKRISSKDFPSL